MGVPRFDKSGVPHTGRIARRGRRLPDRTADVLRHGHAGGFGRALHRNVIMAVQADLRADRARAGRQPIPRSSMRSSGVPHARQITA